MVRDLTADGTDHPADAATAAPEDHGGLLELPGMLARAASGITFVYQALELLALRFGLRDALVVVDSPAVRRQAFRLGRRLDNPRRGSGIPAVGDAPAGLYTDPPAIDGVGAAYVTNLVEVAVRLDVARHDATRDPLTGLLNRRSYEEALEQAAARSRRYGWPFALVMLDLDRFKTINDEWGHAGGDDALRAFGAHIQSCLRTGDVAARVGGDEFALLVLAATERPAVTSLVERLRLTSTIGTTDDRLRFSAGIAVFPDDAEDPGELSRIADERLYADKPGVP